MCVSYSGQCFSSEAWGGRSANRGQCAQACRLPYGLLVNCSLAELGDIQYLLSPQDLSGLGHVAQLIQAGVHCFKIEGRLKDPAFVASSTTAYREAIDYAWRRLREGATVEEATLPPERLLELSTGLAQVFARAQDESNPGLTPGFLEGARHQRLVRGRSPGHRGVLVGPVVRVDVARNSVTVVRDPAAQVSAARLKRGDGVVFDSRRARRTISEGAEQGGAVYDVQGADASEQDASSPVQLTFGRASAIDLSK